MRKGMVRKGFVLGILVFLVFAGISTINGGIVKNNVNIKFKGYDWWNQDWMYRKQITINHTKVTTNHNNFPILISVISSDFINHAQFDGDDFVFVSEDNTKTYNHEIEYYKSSTGKLLAWVNITSLSSDFNTILYLYYGNSECGSQQNIDDVWDSDYIHVWHMGDNLNDSAGSDDGTNYGTDIITGKIGECRDFEKSKYDFIIFGDMAQPADGVLNVGTWEAWINIDDVSADCPMMIKYATGGTDKASYHSSIKSGGKPKFNVYKDDNGNYFIFTANNNEIQPSNWHYLAFGITIGTIRNIDIYVDGMEVPSTKTIGGSQPIVFRDTTKDDEIGRYRTSVDTYYYDYKIDEMRWSKIVRTDAWINTSYNTMNNPSSFFSIGAEEPVNYPPSKPVDVYPKNGSIHIPIDIELLWESDDPEGSNVTFDIYFGNSTPPPKIVDNQSYASFDPGSLKFCTTYYWKIVAWDEDGASTEGDIWQFKTICNAPPEATRINGPTTGKSGKTYSYTFVSNDQNEDNVFYEIDWGDGQIEPWDGPHPANTVITKSHSWQDQGTFKISARAKDEYENVGDWGELFVEIPRYKSMNNQLINFLIDNFPILQRIINLIGLI